MEIKLHTVGHIIDGDKYKDWFVFVQTYRNAENYLVLICNSKTFGADEEGNTIEGLEGYDEWIIDLLNLEHYFSYHNWKVEWLNWKPAWLEDVAE